MAIFIVVALTSLAFYGCRKDGLLPTDVSIPDTPISPQYVAQKPLTVEEVRDAYEKEIREEKEQQNLLLGTSLPLDIVPNWATSVNGKSPKGNDFVITSLNREVQKKGILRLVSTKNAVGTIINRYVLYLPDSAYFAQTKGKLDPNTYTGATAYFSVGLNKFIFGFYFVNGVAKGLSKIISITEGAVPALKNTPELQERGCETRTHIEYIPCSNDNLQKLSLGCIQAVVVYDVIKCDEFNLGFSSWSPGGLQGGGGDGTWPQNQPSNIFQQQKTLITQAFASNGLNAALDYLQDNNTALLRVYDFLQAKGWTDGHKAAINQLATASVNPDLMGEYFFQLQNPENPSMFYYNCKANGFVKAYEDFATYVNIGFTVDDFTKMYSNNVLYSQVNNFLTLKGFVNNEYAQLARDHSRMYISDTDYQQTVDEYNQLARSVGGGSGLFGDMVSEIAKIAIKKALKKIFPEWDISDELLDASGHFASGDYLALLGDVVAIGRDIAKIASKSVSPWVLAAIAAIEGAPVIKKGISLYKRFDIIKNNLSSQVFDGVWKALKSFKFSNGKDWYDSVDDIIENSVEKNLQFNGSLQAFFNHLKNQFPGTNIINIGGSTLETQTLAFNVGNVYIMYYRDSRTFGTPTLHFSVNDYGSPRGNGTTIIKFRQ